MKMKKVLIALFAISLVPNISFAGPKAEVLHWWTSGGEAKALSVLKADFAAKGGVWTDMPVAGGGGDAAMQTLKARIVAGDSPAAAKLKDLQFKNMMIKVLSNLTTSTLLQKLRVGTI